MLKNTTLLCCVTLLSGYGLAAGTEKPTGLYFGGSLGWSHLEPQPDDNAPYNVSDKNGFTFRLHGGYLLTPKLSGELSFASLGTTGIAKDSDPDKTITDINYYATSAAVLYRLWDYDHPYNLFAKGELSTFSTDSSGEDIPINNDNTILLGFGFGASYRLNQQFNLRADFDSYSADAKSLTLGIEWQPAKREMPADADHDGVIDELDHCPDSKPGATVDSMGCEVAKDSDGDGVSDAIDQCPATPTDLKVDSTGCALDSDQDGYPDYQDQCPHSTVGVKVNDKGCEADKDSDADRVADSMDFCPDTPAGLAVNLNGCELDDDIDGVVNRLDQCPDTPVEQSVNEIGCPLTYEQTVQQKIAIIEPSNIQFATDSAELTEDARRELLVLVSIMNSYDNISIDINAYTDNVGREKYNLSLSQKRADGVKAYLVEQGIAAERLTAEGYGEASPVADNATAEGRSLNRRVEFIVKGIN
ncbi:OmpA family protein [Gynuella sp.]|uniref:OmpA family protein n=1 Tax=Gynuella sp. TaxID=2969146 RepID=UPI003D0F00D4